MPSIELPLKMIWFFSPFGQHDNSPEENRRLNVDRKRHVDWFLFWLRKQNGSTIKRKFNVDRPKNDRKKHFSRRKLRETLFSLMNRSFPLYQTTIYAGFSLAASIEYRQMLFAYRMSKLVVFYRDPRQENLLERSIPLISTEKFSFPIEIFTNAKLTIDSSAESMFFLDWFCLICQLNEENPSMNPVTRNRANFSGIFILECIR